jgi:hypothetical protein
LCLFLKYPKNISFFFIQYEKLDALLNEVKEKKQKKDFVFKITKYKIQNTKYKIQNTKYKIQNTNKF